MRVELKAWSDTGNVDLRLLPDTDGEKALLVLLKDRAPRHSEAQDSSGTIELVFESRKP